MTVMRMGRAEIMSLRVKRYKKLERMDRRQKNNKERMTMKVRNKTKLRVRGK